VGSAIACLSWREVGGGGRSQIWRQEKKLWASSYVYSLFTSVYISSLNTSLYQSIHHSAPDRFFRE
jgi:hypothetical protein